jgi:hypothetical protein
MVNYQLGKIYKIVGNGLTYYGSTCEPILARRLSSHVRLYRSYKNDKHNKTMSFDIIELGDYSIVLVECFACDTKDELHARERFFIETNECINKCIPGRAVKESYKVYRDTHKEQLKERNQRYQDTHKEQVKIYRDTHKEHTNEKFICNCGGRYTHVNRLVHFKTKKHLDYITQESAMLDNSLLL